MFDRIALKAEMARQCISISELASKSGTGYDTLSKILNTDRQPNIVTIGRLAKALNVLPEKLMRKEE